MRYWSAGIFASMSFLAACDAQAQDRFLDSERIISEALSATLELISQQNLCINALAEGQSFLTPCGQAHELYFDHVVANDLGLYLDALLERAQYSGRADDLELGNEYMFRISEARRLFIDISTTLTRAQSKALMKAN